MSATLPPPRLLPSGDSAITVEFSRNIDDAANQRVLALNRTIAREPIAGVTETVPTYRSLLVHYDPVQIGFDALSEQLVALARLPVPPVTTTRRWRIPVVYGGEHGIVRIPVAEEVQHHRRRPGLPDRIGDAAAGDIGRRAMHRLEQARPLARRIQVGRRRDADRSGAGRAEVGQDVDRGLSSCFRSSQCSIRIPGAGRAAPLGGAESLAVQVCIGAHVGLDGASHVGGIALEPDQRRFV